MFPFNKEVLGRVLGPARGEGNEMAQWVLKANGNVIPRRTVRPLQVAEIHSETEKKKRKLFDELIERRWGTSINPPKALQRQSTDDLEDSFDYTGDIAEDANVLESIIEDAQDSRGRLLNQQPAYDRIINAEVQLQLGDSVAVGKVRKRAIGPEGVTTGVYHDNPILNSVVYEVEFPDGQIREYAANVIAENMLSQIDSEGYSTTLMSGIIDYNRNDNAIEESDKYVVTRSGQRRL